MSSYANNDKAKALDTVVLSLYSYESVKKGVQIMNKEYEKKTGVSVKTTTKMAGIAITLGQKRLSTKFIKIGTEVNGIEIRPSMEYQMESKATVATLGFSYSF